MLLTSTFAWVDSLKAGILELPFVYRCWQAPFVKKKTAPIFKHNRLDKVRRVLDLGCGPGTNAPLFASVDYTGIDINPNYITSAIKRYGNKFKTADIRDYSTEPGERYDFIFINSFLHHIDDANTEAILAGAANVLSNDGCIHILELVLPARRCIARQMAQWDRGDFPRPLEKWRSLFSAYFEERVFEPYSVDLFDIPLWQMVYFKGCRREDKR